MILIFLDLVIFFLEKQSSSFICLNLDVCFLLFLRLLVIVYDLCEQWDRVFGAKSAVI